MKIRSVRVFWKEISLIFMVVAAGCTSEENFPSLGRKIASPVDVVTSEDGEYFYALNADFDRTYNTGSLLVLDRTGKKISATEVPRLGRALALADNDLIVAIDEQDDESPAQVQLFDVSQPENPTRTKSWTVQCSPINVALRKGYEHFAVTCAGGKLYIGTLKENRSSSELKKVRNYRYSRRALYLDPQRELLLGFVTDLAPAKNQTWSDDLYKDVATYNENADKVEDAGPNEIPDAMEDEERDLTDKERRGVYQFFVYDLAKEAEEGFPYRSKTSPEVEQELRWLYFKLRNFDGTPDDGSKPHDPDFKYYRANFWKAEPALDDPNAFYLSHRGRPGESPHANQILRVSFSGDLRIQEDEEGEGSVPPTGQVLRFERVSGFKGPESSKKHFPGDFELTRLSGESVLVINHFRDAIHWDKGQRYFAVAAKTLGSNYWYDELSSRDPESGSWFQVAVMPDGRALTCSFYGNELLLLEVRPGVGIKELKRIN